MKITMIGDCAHVGCELAKELRKRGHSVKHITFNHDSKLRFLKALTVPLRLMFDDCDLVHAHYARFPMYAAALSRKPFVVHCHGSDLRLGISKTKEYFLRKAKRIIASTPDLQNYRQGMTYLPNPVPWEFNNMNAPKSGGVYFRHKQDPTLPPHLRDFTDCEVRERNVPFTDMPKVLNSYKYVLDFHFHCLSKLALEALGCGCKVVTWDGEVVEGLPDKHRPEQVVDRLLEIYKEALQ